MIVQKERHSQFLQHVAKIKKVKVRLILYTSQVTRQARAYPGFCSMKWLGVFLLPPGWDASPSQGYPQVYTWVERGTVRVKCLAQVHNTMSPARAWTRTARSRDEHTNHEATAPPQPRSSLGINFFAVLIIKTPFKVLIQRPYDSLCLQFLLGPKELDFVAYKHHSWCNSVRITVEINTPLSQSRDYY